MSKAKDEEKHEQISTNMIGTGDGPVSDLSEESGAVKKFLLKLFPGWGTVSQRESTMVGLPASASSYFTGDGRYAKTTKDPADLLSVTNCKDGKKISYTLPEDRIARYAILRTMARDPTIDCAIQMHISNALSVSKDTGKSVFIESADGKDNAIVDDLNAVLMPYINRDINEWARKAAVYGSCFVRVYGEEGVGITNIRCDFYTHPRLIQKYEKSGKLAGFTSSYQGTSQFARKLQLLPPWTFVGFEIPEWWDAETVEPINVSGIPVDLSIDDPAMEGLIQSQDYGTSLISTAYGPWLDLLDAVCSLKMSRRNAARLERIVGVNTGRLDPERAARFLDMVAERVSNSTAEVEKQSWLNGNVQTVVNHFLPVFSEKGGLQIDSVQGTPDINGLEDVLFHIKRLGSALGVDPSLLGFGDFLSGGLGDGGFFRMSVMAATKSSLLRQAIQNGIQRLCEIHCAYKFKKAFVTDEYPWKIRFNSISSALEREEQESLEMRSNLMGGIIGAIATVDQEFAIADKRSLVNYLWKNLRLDEDQFDKIFPEEKAKQAEQNAKAMTQGGEEY